ncbi:MAG: polysaccharide biosynthesis tyrosine autokinase [Chloroflexi bacterium]|nr:polysaccharide biosynthesis tyrosine autokinase [Chloroflexota bacterium]
MRVGEELEVYLKVLWRYKWMIIACALIASVVAFGVSKVLTPRYSATATLRLASAPIGDYDYAFISALTRLSNTFVEIASSDASLDEVAHQFGLEEQPKVEVEVVPETELITIRATDPDPARARDIANVLSELMVEKGLQLYHGNAPTAREILEGQLAQAKADLDAAVDAYDTALRSSMTTPEPADAETSTASGELTTLERLVSIRQQIYSDLLQRYEDTRISEQMRANALTIIEPASLPERPSQPKVALNTALGLLAGSATGVVLAFLFEGMDKTLRGIEDVQAMTALPILCQIPERKRTLASTAAPLSTGANGLLPMLPFHQLRARLTLSGVRGQPARFLVTSPEPSDGKSTVAAHLALSFAEGGHRVVLVDMDLRRPTLHSILHLPNELGLSDYLCNKIQLVEAVQDTPYPNLRVVTAGSTLDGESEWWAPVRLRALLEDLVRDSDYVVVDAPALLSAADAAIIASQVDAVILVVARRRTERRNLDLALQQLTDLRVGVAGVVVNKAPNSQVYTHYSERHLKGEPSRQLESPKRLAAAARSKLSRVYEELVNVVLRLRSSH